MLYLLLFYWIFAGLFIFGGVYCDVKKNNGNFISEFIVSIILGGIIVPLVLGRKIMN